MLTTARMLLVVSILMLSTSVIQAQESTDVQPESTEDAPADAEEDIPTEGSASTDVTNAEHIATDIIDTAAAALVVVETDASETAFDEAVVAVEDESWKQLSPTYSERSPLPISGKAMYYNPGVMARVYQNRLDSGRVEPCPECIGRVAMLRFGDLNRKVWIQLPDQSIEGPFLVVDAADTKHVGMLLAREWIIDIDYETARRWRMFNPRYVTVLPELTSIVDIGLRHKREFTVDIYRSEKMRYNNQTSAYFGGADELYVK